MPTIAELLEWGKLALTKQEIPQLEAQILLAFVLGTDRSYLYTWPEREINQDQVKQYEDVIARRIQHEPIAYIIGKKEFWSLTFEVTRDTLIPRAETELLVQTVLEYLPKTEQHIVDVGTGCGTIACALAHERPHWQLIGLEISNKAIEVAKRNAKNLQLNNVNFIESNWLANLPHNQYDAIIGNPPYIRGGDVHLIHGDLPFEPEIALTPGLKGLEAFQILLAQAKDFLKPGGLIAFEHGFDQRESLTALFEQAGLKEIKTFQDFSGNDRVTLGRH